MAYLVMLPQMHICVHGIERVILRGLVRGKLLISMIITYIVGCNLPCIKNKDPNHKQAQSEVL